jgi:3-hydroxyacyl-[acyl-carrier-protein] dehydratase
VVVAAPLFELAGFDLDAVAISAEEVGRLNPQSGAMRQIDHVVWMDVEAGRMLAVKDVGDDEFWVPGHIPGRPLYPGVLMIEAGAQLASILYRMRSKEDRFVGFTRCDDAVFRGQVVPGDTLYVLASEIHLRRRRFVCAVQGIVRDTIVFEAKVTGMVM